MSSAKYFASTIEKKNEIKYTLTNSPVIAYVSKTSSIVAIIYLNKFEVSLSSPRIIIP